MIRRIWPRSWRAWAGLALLGVAVSVAGWTTTDALEQDDAFCVSCHLPDGVALHRENKRDFEGRPPVSLAVAHAAAGNEARDDGAFRCIDCHGGASFVGRARVKLLSAKDAFWYVTGRFEEPSGMHWPLWDEDCTQCHDRFAQGPGEENGEHGEGGDEAHIGYDAYGGGEAPAADPDYHAVPVHNTESPVRCVDCHGSHERGGLAERDFLIPGIVRAECARCHEEYEEGD